MRRLSWFLASAASIACVRMLGACYPGTDCDFGLCPGPPVGGYPAEAGADGQIVVPADCELAKSPKDSPACLEDSVGIFVSPDGDDSAPGEKQAPVRSITKAVELAGTRRLPRVYVCEGTYDSNVEVKASVAIFGGLTCAWAPSEAARPKLAPPKGTALRVTKVEAPVHIETFDIVGSADVAVPGDSAIGVFVSESSSVSFRDVNVSAGAGTAGQKGASRSNYTGTTASVGGNANGATAGPGTSCSCVDTSSSKGGDGAAGNGADVGNGSAIPAVGALNGGSSGPTGCGEGQPGANGAANGAGAPGTAPGVLAANSWTPAAPPDNAPNGNPGQGGGGGGARTNINSAGGGGACGGCGGAGGEPGKSAGSSFALLSFNSNVTVDGGSLTTGSGGRGGEGGEGQSGQAGGGPGAGACDGGPGGHGAGGSGGGGGAGGHSVPVAFVGSAPRITGAKLTPGAKGPGGDGGKPGQGPGNAGNPGAPGAEGKAQETLAL